MARMDMGVGMMIWISFAMGSVVTIVIICISICIWAEKDDNKRKREEAQFYKENGYVKDNFSKRNPPLRCRY